MYLLVVVTPTSGIYHGWSTQKKFWEENFTLVNMTSFGRRNVSKQKEYNNGKQYIAFEIYFELDCLDSMEVTSL